MHEAQSGFTNDITIINSRDLKKAQGTKQAPHVYDNIISSPWRTTEIFSNNKIHMEHTYMKESSRKRKYIWLKI